MTEWQPIETAPKDNPMTPNYPDTEKTDMPDRGSAHSLVFEKCDIGFILRSPNPNGLPTRIYAFACIESLAAWLVEEYGETQ